MITLEHFDVAVIGGGVFGLASALELCRRGHVVGLIDRFGSGHPATSSSGRSRGIRIAYDHPFYVELARKAIDGWRTLEAGSGRRILHLRGQVDFGAGEKLDSILAAVRATGARIEELDASGLRRRLPEFAPFAGERWLFHAEAGTVLADEGLNALAEAVDAAGVRRFAPERVLGVQTGNSQRVLTDRRQLCAPTVVVAAGPWSADLLAPLGISLPLAPAIAQVTFLDAPALVERPGFGEWGANGETGVYGHPVPGASCKLAFDTGQDGWGPEVTAWTPDREEQARLLAWMERRLPGFPRRVQRSERHPWTMTPDADFIVDRRGGIVLACGCSGHAFKFGPALGSLVADAVEGRPPQDLLRLDRPSLQRSQAFAGAPISR